MSNQCIQVQLNEQVLSPLMVMPLTILGLKVVFSFCPIGDMCVDCQCKTPLPPGCNCDPEVIWPISIPIINKLPLLPLLYQLFQASPEDSTCSASETCVQCRCLQQVEHYITYIVYCNINSQFVTPTLQFTSPTLHYIHCNNINSQLIPTELSQLRW